ncbi:MAG: flagellar hook assembly protein FlgD [Proteobacteria bacterium]|nr:flagellar hook assembly protein FlgD [Pseudomonadota bacterium]
MTVSATTSSSSTSTDLSQLNAASGTTSADDTSDRFLKLLVAQMQNQDPLNPMDNSEVTTQMAQIQTVQGVGQLNTSIQGLSTQFVQMQALQAASLVGKEVTVPGNQLTVADGAAQGGYNLASAATSVQIDVYSGAGQLIQTLHPDGLTAGVNTFDWNAGSQYSGVPGITFKVTATNGSNPVTSTALMQDKVDSVSTSGGQLMLNLDASGTVPYTTVQTLN